MKKVYKYKCTKEEWKEFIATMNSGDKFEVDEEMYYYWLEVLPPIFMHKWIDFLPGHEGHKMRVEFGFAEGADYITVFFRSLDGKRFYGQKTNKMAH